MKITSTRELYFQPVLFKTISFHHQSEYFLEFQLKYRQPHILNSISAYPSIVQSQFQGGFNRKKIFRPQNTNKAQTEKFLILFNDQSIVLKGGCNFIVQTDRDVGIIKDTRNKVQTQLIVSLFKHPISKDSNQIISLESKSKIEKVGQQIICINFDVNKDFSQNSSYRNIVFTSDEYFSSFLFYIDFVHLGMNLRLKNSLQINRLNQLDSSKKYRRIKQCRKQIQKQVNPTTFRQLLQFKELKKLYKLLIQDRLKEFKKIVQTLKNQIQKRKKYVNNYEIEQPEYIQSTSFLNNGFSKDLILSLTHLQYLDIEGNDYFFQYYETDSIDQVYGNLYYESKAITQNIRKVWNQIIKLKLKTLPQQFQNLALSYKIDRMTKITKIYSAIDEVIYSTESDVNQRLKNHFQARINFCQNCKFYNMNQMKHSMLTFHSQKTQSTISNTVQKDQAQILVILVHGFKGSQRDMAKIKSFINTFTSINFLPLQTLTKQKNQDIQTLGSKAADQIKQFLIKKPHITSINFIGFSLGGVLIKAILSNLQSHKQKFNLCLTLSSPHLGITQIQNCLVNTGVYYMKKITRIKNIKQLCCQPLNKKISNDITLLSLSQKNILSWFNHVVLVGSNEDTFVPKYSSLLAYRGSDQVVSSIQQNTLKSIKSLDRITVWFEYQENCVQKLTGRKGHISFIEDDTFLQYIIIKYLHFF